MISHERLAENCSKLTKLIAMQKGSSLAAMPLNWNLLFKTNFDGKPDALKACFKRRLF
jgi:hypothetical protein